MLTDAQWAVLGPLVESCRPPAKVPPSNLRRTVGAILRRHQNGAKWRSVPEEFGPWWMAAETFIRWSRLRVWERPETPVPVLVRATTDIQPAQRYASRGSQRSTIASGLHLAGNDKGVW